MNGEPVTAKELAQRRALAAVRTAKTRLEKAEHAYGVALAEAIRAKVTHAQIAKAAGVSRSRVTQIATREGDLAKDDGGQP